MPQHVAAGSSPASAPQAPQAESPLLSNDEESDVASADSTKSVAGEQTTAGCTVTVACEGDTCIACQSLKDNTMLKDIVERAGRSMSSENGRSLNYEYMMKQTEERARAATASMEATRLKTLNIRRQALRIGRKLEEFKIMMFLGQDDVCDVRRV